MIDILEMQNTIGVSKKKTDQIVEYLKKSPVSDDFFSTYKLLILERYTVGLEFMAALSKPVLRKSYINELLNSKFHLHHVALASLLSGNTEENKKEIVEKLIEDNSLPVLIELVQTILVCKSEFSADDLEKFYKVFISKKSVFSQSLGIKILPEIENNEKEVVTIMFSRNWRHRANLARNLGRFKETLQNKIISVLKKDKIEEVRVYLSSQIHTTEHLDLLGDPSESVRGNYLKNIIHKIEDENVLVQITNDQSWEVRKWLLDLKGVYFQKIAIPLIVGSTQNMNWRFKKNIISMIGDKMEDEYLIKNVMFFLMETLVDQTYEVRHTAQRVLIEALHRYEWFSMYDKEIVALVRSGNYLYRSIVAPLVIEYDIKYGTVYGQTLFTDPIPNVKQIYREYKGDFSASIP